MSECSTRLLGTINCSNVHTVVVNFKLLSNGVQFAVSLMQTLDSMLFDAVDSKKPHWMFGVFIWLEKSPDFVADRAKVIGDWIQFRSVGIDKEERPTASLIDIESCFASLIQTTSVIKEVLKRISRDHVGL